MSKLQASLAPRDLGLVNWVGFWTLFCREVKRFVKVFGQTVTAPVVTALLYYTVFSVAFAGRGIETIGDVSFMSFLVPGLIMMSMAQNAFMNSSSSLMISKYDGSIVDFLMPPLSNIELALAKSLGGVVRGMTVGLVTMITFGLLMGFEIYSLPYIIAYAFFGTFMLSQLGLMVGIWADKFDNTSAVSNFLITPLTFLSGTFYSITRLPEKWQAVASYNPFFYMIDGFRYGFTGHADGNLMVGLSVLIGLNIILLIGCVYMLHTGYKIKN